MPHICKLVTEAWQEALVPFTIILVQIYPNTDKQHAFENFPCTYQFKKYTDELFQRICPHTAYSTISFIYPLML